jgi:hypothetical protein
VASTSTVRRARKTHWCGSCARHSIRLGDQYILGTIFPGDDCGQPRRGGHPVRIRECRECAERYGRGDRFTPIEAKTNA